jgi:hypothetical protein
MARRNERCAALNCRCSLSGNNNLCGWPKAVHKRPGYKCLVPLNPDISVLYTVGNMFDPVRRAATVRARAPDLCPSPHDAVTGDPHG